ncbi:2-hydroxymuconic semialdehyde dehydrogenase [Arcobacter defluvii]|uniref:2-hydroxymuconic semialdehyde dehydrogenase n=2 Tax=Arcobacter TaxID=28196 RepID=A0AAE7BIB1_9BACT|nr:2-hydroxymuconic semialdehyde dehydrogenase [Arcobacter defluvii]QKF78537.1 2-hydroxymuconic semialdehyde dehydrogenase [Arcobacter defluvii]RXI31268.1 2-hydroxymuconic semialdehyde dehydrogenase [Arcobacter defluvii]
MKKVQHYINGQFIDSQCGEFFDNFNPATAELISKVALGREAEVNAAVAAAKAALTGEWGQMKLNDRVALMYEVADEINRRFDDFLEAECLDTGKPYSIARHIDIPRGGANFKVFADTMKSYADEAYRADTPDGKKMLNYSMRKPKGVIAVISPWNLPLLLMTWKVGPAMACGNSVVVKPSQVTPTTTSLLGEVMSKVGVPAGAYNVVQGKGSITGNLLTAHKDIDAITFTGETVTGEMIMKACSVGVRDVSLELGGKNPAIIFADCDMQKAVHETTRSCFANSGQVCLGTERVYVQRPIFDEFVAKLKESASKLKLGVQHDESVDMGPLVSAAHRDKVLEFYEIAKKEGANVVLGGGAPKMEGALSNGFWVEPTIWTGLPESATVVQQEVFGPCCHITPFDIEEDAIRMANDTKYGLASTIFTENLDKAHRVASQIDSGIVWINSWFLRDLRTPFGGMKASGIGREGGHHSLEFYTELKNICIKM